MQLVIYPKMISVSKLLLVTVCRIPQILRSLLDIHTALDCKLIVAQRVLPHLVEFLKAEVKLNMLVMNS